MAQIIEPATAWTAADLVERFGAIPLARVRLDPAPGSATEADVVAIHDQEDRLYELVDGVLVEKTVGAYESYLAYLLGTLLNQFVMEYKPGIVLGPDGMLRLAPGLVRIPDVSYISFDRLPNREVPRDPIAELAPDLAVEVLSRGNTRQEMERKLADYFAAGVRLVWYLDPQRREVRVFTSPEAVAVVGESQTLDGGNVLPGFSLELQRLFAEPAPKA